MANLIFHKGKSIALDNPDEKTSIVGNPVEKNNTLFFPIGVSGISIVKFNSIDDVQEIGRWGVPTEVFPGAEKPPFRPTIFISSLKLSGDYIFAFDLNLPIIYILRIVSDELFFVNYIRKPVDFSDRPLAKERLLEYMVPLYIGSDNIHFMYNIDIQKIFVDQNDVGEWAMSLFYEKIDFTSPPISFNEFNLNPTTTNPRDLSVANNFLSLPSTVVPFDGVANEVEIDSSQVFFNALAIQNIYNTQDAQNAYSCFNINLQNSSPLFENKDNRLYLIKNQINGNQNTIELFSPISLGIGSETENNSPLSICESNNFIFIACNKSGLKRFIKTNLSSLDATLNILDDNAIDNEDILGCQSFGTFLYILTQSTTGRMLRIYSTDMAGEITFLDRTSFTGDFQPDILHLLEGGSYLLSDENLLEVYYYGVDTEEEIDPGQDTSGFGLTRPYSRPGWFTDHLLENFKFKANCQVVYNGYGMDGCEISYLGQVGHQNPFIPPASIPDVPGPQVVQISPVKSEKYKVDSFKEFFDLLLNGKSGRLWGMQISLISDEVYIVEKGAFVFEGEIIENTEVINLLIPNITTTTVLKYDSITQEITFNTSGNSNSNELVLAKHMVDEEANLRWIMERKLLTTPKVLTATPHRIFLKEDNRFSFDLFNP